MSENEESRLRDDMQLRLVEGGPASYVYRTGKPVEYVAIASESVGILGYVWACDADDAAGWEARLSLGPIAMNGGAYWFARLRETKARGLLPSQALDVLSADTEGGWSGRVVPGSRATATSVEALREKAREGWEPPAQPEPPRGRRR
ncbi:hypothetical protein ACH4E7_00355 [Kitasatospora sp. NPDC018058]|uniref:hypothetical protein n=1 Tax=Kitasatospora sp. NPDC018058 TaxID=3364025 RepID=UPI0037C13393